jgi:hypothetical protein
MPESDVLCSECWCAIPVEMQQAHQDWHGAQNKALVNALRIATAALDDVARLRVHILELEGKAP